MFSFRFNIWRSNTCERLSECLTESRKNLTFLFMLSLDFLFISVSLSFRLSFSLCLSIYLAIFLEILFIFIICQYFLFFFIIKKIQSRWALFYYFLIAGRCFRGVFFNSSFFLYFLPFLFALLVSFFLTFFFNFF